MADDDGPSDDVARIQTTGDAYVWAKGEDTSADGTSSTQNLRVAGQLNELKEP